MHTLTTSLSPSTFFLHHSFFPFTTRFRNPVQRFTSLTLLGSSKKRNCHKVLCKNRENENKENKNEDDGDSSFLAAEILDFMQNSNNLNAFPTREELVAAGRVDLVEAIEKEGGWFLYGWDLNEDGIDQSLVSEYGSSLTSLDQSYQPDRLTDTKAEESGIEGISNRPDKDHRDHRATKEAVDAIIESGSRLFQTKLDQHNETWKGNMSNVSGQSKIRDFSNEPTNGETGLRSLDRNSIYNDIKSCILHLESDLSCVLYSLRSTSNKVTRKTDQRSSSDACELQQNEIINAQDRLHEILANLAVLGGKMELAIMDAQKIIEKQQKMINDANRALQLLKDTTVVWPNTASEVFLVGSFDGWSTQRKMKKATSGVFTLSLKLYPGKYEIKFIVDGKWKINPHRLTVNNNGHVNNLLFVR